MTAPSSASLGRRRRASTPAGRRRGSHAPPRGRSSTSPSRPPEGQKRGSQGYAFGHEAPPAPRAAVSGRHGIGGLSESDRPSETRRIFYRLSRTVSSLPPWCSLDPSSPSIFAHPLERPPLSCARLSLPAVRPREEMALIRSPRCFCHPTRRRRARGEATTSSSSTRSEAKATLRDELVSGPPRRRVCEKQRNRQRHAGDRQRNPEIRYREELWVRDWRDSRAL